MLIAYQFSIRRTIDNFQNWQANKISLQSAASAPVQIQEYQNQIASLEKNFKQVIYDRETLFEVVNTFCRENQLSLTNFPPEIRKEQNDYRIITNEIEVQGKYANMVRLAYELEFVKQLGHIASTTFKREQNRQTKRTELKGTIYLQNLQNLKNEKQ